MNRNSPGNIRRLALAFIIAAAASLSPADTAWAAKNVILMVSDGAGHNTWLAASMYQARVGKQVYDQPGWLRLACSTYPLNLSTKPTGNQTQDPSVLYDLQQAWSVTPLISKKALCVGYAYLTATPTDSAASATAMATGQKTYNQAINWSNDDRAMRGRTIAEIAKAHGKSTGIITTVQWSDATPAALGGAHNANRNNHAQIANEMLDGGWLDVIMGAGNPDFDNDGRVFLADAKRDYQWVGGKKTWTALKQGKRGWTLVENAADFDALASGPTPPKLVGIPRVANTLQEKRGRPMSNSKSKTTRSTAAPFAVPFNRNLPTLTTMTKAAINCLDDNPKGFYLMIEGGAVDWANHANEPERMIEEQIDYVKAVEAVADWVDKNSNWNDTLLILTADHECGLLWGPKSKKVAFDPIQDNGPCQLPGMKHNSTGHSNSLVPLYARGPGSNRFAELVRGADPKAAAVWRFSGKYIDNTDIFAVMKAEVTK